MSSVPDSLRWLFWDLDVEHFDLEEHCAAILGRVLEYGRLRDVRLVLEIYGTRRILEFFRDGGHPLLSERTRSFWRAFWDLEAIATRGAVSLREASEAYLLRFGVAEADLYHVFRALTYFEDAERDPAFPEGLTAQAWQDLKAFFRREVPRLIQTDRSV